MHWSHVPNSLRRRSCDRHKQIVSVSRLSFEGLLCLPHDPQASFAAVYPGSNVLLLHLRLFFASVNFCQTMWRSHWSKGVGRDGGSVASVVLEGIRQKTSIRKDFFFFDELLRSGNEESGAEPEWLLLESLKHFLGLPNVTFSQIRHRNN